MIVGFSFQRISAGRTTYTCKEAHQSQNIVHIVQESTNITVMKQQRTIKIVMKRCRTGMSIFKLATVFNGWLKRKPHAVLGIAVGHRTLSDQYC